VSGNEQWLRSSFCADSACVEVADLGDRIAMRDGKRPEQAPIEFDRRTWNVFLDGIVRDRFEAR
jgi:hypothetical protein